MGKGSYENELDSLSTRSRSSYLRPSSYFGAGFLSTACILLFLATQWSVSSPSGTGGSALGPPRLAPTEDGASGQVQPVESTSVAGTILPTEAEAAALPPPTSPAAPPVASTAAPGSSEAGDTPEGTWPPLPWGPERELRFQDTIVGIDGGGGLLEHYAPLYEAIMSGEKPLRVALFKQPAKSGWGNHIRGMFAQFSFAIATERLFLMEAELMFRFYQDPDDFTVAITSIDQDAGTLVAGGQKWSNLTFAEIPFTQGQYKSPFLEKSALEYTEDVVVFSCGCAFDKYLSLDAAAEAGVVQAFRTTSRASRLAQFTEWILSRPQPAFMDIVSELYHRNGMHRAQVNVGVQLRAWSDWNQRHEWTVAHMAQLNGCFADAIEDFVGRIQKEYRGPTETVIYFTSDDAKLLPQIREGLGHLGRVVSDDLLGNNKHTVQIAKGSDLIRHAGMASFYMLGGLDMLVASGTTYSQTAQARTTFQHPFYVCPSTEGRAEKTKWKYFRIPTGEPGPTDIDF